ncbi:MAG: hypothetical protein JWO69_1436 [Thermoleophilia bacterium]|jgi:uncharacterized membrane protein YuzA (DUF378 family)|nr:hypothetical protein [Thermoleophilia bacterium]
MKLFNLETIAMFLLVIGGLNAGVNAVFEFNALGEIMSSSVSTVFYALVGLSAVYAIADHIGWVGSED